MTGIQHVPPLASALRAAAMRANKEMAISEVQVSLGVGPERRAEAVLADIAQEDWRHWSLDKRSERLRDYIKVEIEYLEERK